MTVLTRGAFPASALLHERLRAAHVARLPAVPRVDGAGAHAADVSEDRLRDCFSMVWQHGN